MKRKWFWATILVAVGLLLIGGLWLPLSHGVRLLSAAPTFCPTPIAATPAPIVDINRTITVVGRHGLSRAGPGRGDGGVETRGDTVQEATGESADIMEALLEALEQRMWPSRTFAPAAIAYGPSM